MKERAPRPSNTSVEHVLQLAQRLSGIRPQVRWVDDLGQGLHAELIRPIQPGLPYEIRLARNQAPIAEHLILHEVGHLVRLHQVPPAERLVPARTMPTRQRVAHQLWPELIERGMADLPPEVLADMIAVWHEGLATQLVNFPADLRIEQWVHQQFRGSRAVQRRALLAEVERSNPLFHPAVRRLTPPTVYEPTMLMNAAQAVVVARLLNRPDVVRPFAERGLAAEGIALAEMVLAQPDEGHRSDIAAANAWAERLGIAGWVEWVPPAEARVH